MQYLLRIAKKTQPSFEGRATFRLSLYQMVKDETGHMAATCDSVALQASSRRWIKRM